MYAYCLFCQTQRCEMIAETINSITDHRCFMPRIVQRYWLKGEALERIHPYLPGYLFLYTEEPVEDFGTIRSIAGVIRILGLEEQGYQLTGSDLAFARMLYQMDGCLGILKVRSVGDRVRIATELYEGFTGEIVRLDKRKRRAMIRFDFDGKEHHVWVAVDKIKDTDE